MKNCTFAVKIKAILEDGTEVSEVVGSMINDKKVFKTSDGEILTGSKKIKTIKFARFVVPPQFLPYIMSRVNE